MIGRRLLLLGSAAGSLSGCGFRPIYMPSAGGEPGVAQRELSAIYVSLIPDRPGQLLRQALQQRLQGAGSSAAALYTLNVNYWITGEAIGIQPSNVATRVRYFGNASWTLIGRDPGQTHLIDGYSRAENAINLVSEQYFSADLQTEAGYGFLAQAVAKEITDRLAIFFRQKASG
jgi:LPS-assembly lipoprotein